MEPGGAAVSPLWARISPARVSGAEAPAESPDIFRQIASIQGNCQLSGKARDAAS
jgi:hypothetical protein